MRRSGLGSFAARVVAGSVLAACASGSGQVPVAAAPPPKPPAPCERAECPTASTGDASQAEHWLPRLERPASRKAAISKLTEIFETRLSESNRDLRGPRVRAFIDGAIGPLTETYVRSAEQLDARTRVELISMLAHFEDARATPAFEKVLVDFVRAPKSDRNDQDLKWAAKAIKALRTDKLAAPLLAAFRALRASTGLGAVTYKDLNAALLEVPSREWVATLISMIAVDIARPRAASTSASDRDAINAYMDQLFWQTTGVQLLGRLGDASAVEPLIQLVLDPAKVDLHPSAALALVQLGAPASDTAAELLRGEHPTLAAACSKSVQRATGALPQNKACEEAAAVIIGSVGRSESIPVMLGVLRSEKDPSLRAVIVRELTKLPPTTDSIAAFKATYEALPLGTLLAAQQPAHDVLTEAAGTFFDPSLVSWMLERAIRAKGAPDEVTALRQVITVTILKLANRRQLASVERAVQRYGTTLEAGLLKQIKPLLASCGDLATCYVEAMRKPENQAWGSQFVGIKAGYMAAILGTAETRDAILDSLDDISNPAVRFVAAEAIDHLSPNGSAHAVSRLSVVIDRNAASPDREKSLGDVPLRQVMARLAARAPRP